MHKCIEAYERMWAVINLAENFKLEKDVFNCDELMKWKDN